MNFYRTLKANGAVQVSTIPEVVTEVAEGRYQLGITLDSQVRAAVKQGSPVVLDWPSDGAISLYSPIAETVAAKGAVGTAAQALLRYVLSAAGQTASGATGATAAAAALVAGLIAALVAVPLWSLGRIAAGAGLTGIWRALSAPGGRVAVIHTVTGPSPSRSWPSPPGPRSRWRSSAAPDDPAYG